MAISLSPDQQQVPFDSVEQETPGEQQVKLEWLRQAIQVGLDDVRDGRFVALNSPDEIKAYIAKLLA